jgi:hypothetical protein
VTNRNPCVHATLEVATHSQLTSIHNCIFDLLNDAGKRLHRNPWLTPIALWLRSAARLIVVSILQPIFRLLVLPPPFSEVPENAVSQTADFIAVQLRVLVQGVFAGQALALNQFADLLVKDAPEVHIIVFQGASESELALTQKAELHEHDG